MRFIFLSDNRNRQTTRAYNLITAARRARGAEGVVAAADLDGHSGWQVDLGAVQLVGMSLLQM